MMELHFSGWFQVRLATDPDPTDEPRGVSGYTFALPGEPDFDRIIRLHDPVAPRRFGPPVGVFVRYVVIDDAPRPGHALEGARFDLLDAPRFEMRNYVLTNETAGTEAIDPFHVEVAGGGVTLRRKDLLDPDNPTLPVWKAPLEKLQRRGGAMTLSPEHFQEVTGLDDYRAFRERRRDAVQEALRTEKDETAAAGLAKRLEQLNIEDPKDRRSLGLTFCETRDFAVNGPATVLDPDGRLGVVPQLDQPWPIRFWNAVWDCDTLCGFMKGTLQIPTRTAR